MERAGRGGAPSGAAAPRFEGRAGRGGASSIRGGRGIRGGGAADEPPSRSMRTRGSRGSGFFDSASNVAAAELVTSTSEA
jgi:hypothetical protein